jgi:hypothetical protein
MKWRRLVPAAVLLACLSQPSVASSALNGDGPAASWPSEQEARLKQLDAQILILQRQRFVAVFARDHDQVEHLDQQMKELHEERQRLLDATGRL